MEQAIKKQFKLSDKTKAVLISCLLAFLGLSAFIYYTLYGHIKAIVHDQAVNSITNISQLNEDSVSRAISNRQILLETAAARLSRRQVERVEVMLAELKDLVDAYEFTNIGLLDEDHILYLVNGMVLDVSDLPQYQAAWDTRSKLSESYMPADGSHHAINVFSFPIYYGEKLKYVLVATYRSAKLTERMNISSMGGKGFTYILNSRGEVAIYPKLYDDEAYSGLMKFINDSPFVIPSASGDSYFEYEGEQYYAHFEPLKINDWTLMTCAREKDVFQEANAIIRGVFWGMGLLWLMVIAAVAATVYSMYRSKRDIRQAVYYDELLGIGNGNALPVFFRDLTPSQLDELALVSFDIDKFKEFNYIYGEEVGDQLLKYIVRVFGEELPQDYLFRYRADHFVALFHCREKPEFVAKMEKLLSRFSKDIDSEVVQPFDISAGVRKLHQGDSYRRAMSDALIAKGGIKGIQLQQYAYYDAAALQRRISYMEMESDFARALQEDEFKVFYQPKYDMRTGRIIGAEALVRWVKGDGTIVSPGAFIPCFEASRQIILLDEAMLQSVCSQMNQMEADGLPVKKVSVNLSRVHLRHHGILNKIETIVKASGVNPANLSFEITESALYEDSIPLKTIVDSLHGLGCRVDMDDYGVGVSGPNSLAANHFDTVKLDKSFIDGIGDQRMEAVIKSTISLSKTLGMEILAEGVEEKYQAESLVKWGCVMAQGFYYCPPVPEREYRRLLAQDAKLSDAAVV